MLYVILNIRNVYVQCTHIRQCSAFQYYIYTEMDFSSKWWCVCVCRVFDVDSYEHWFSDKQTYTYTRTIRFLTSCVECMKTSWMCVWMVLHYYLRPYSAFEYDSGCFTIICAYVLSGYYLSRVCGIFRNRNSLNVEFNYMHWRPSPEARALYNMHDATITNEYCWDTASNVSRAHNALMGIVMQPTNRPHCRWRFLG